MTPIEIALLGVIAASIICIVIMLALCASGYLAPSRIAARAAARQERSGAQRTAYTPEGVYDYEIHGF